jgi:hypothetical protein
MAPQTLRERRTTPRRVGRSKADAGAPKRKLAGTDEALAARDQEPCYARTWSLPQTSSARSPHHGGAGRMTPKNSEVDRRIALPFRVQRGVWSRGGDCPRGGANLQRDRFVHPTVSLRRSFPRTSLLPASTPAANRHPRESTCRPFSSWGPSASWSRSCSRPLVVTRRWGLLPAAGRWAPAVIAWGAQTRSSLQRRRFSPHG